MATVNDYPAAVNINPKLFFVFLNSMENRYQVFSGNALTLLPEFPIEVNTVMTSPPYYKKREYGDDAAEIGKETTVEEYIANLVKVFNTVRLHPRGSVWVNIGDTRDEKGGLRMVPERFALAMKDAGWNLVDNVIWAKVEVADDGEVEGHCMIEPATQRLNGNGHEYLYRFVRCKLADAWADPWAVMLPRQAVEPVRYLPKVLMRTETATNGRCLHNVWRVQIELYRQKHYAPYPTALCERPIVMTCPMNICSKCGHIRSRIVEKRVYDEPKTGRKSRIFGKYTSGEGDALIEDAGRRDAGRHYTPKMPVTVGWTECECKQWMRGVVLDPFVGSGTTGKIALRMGRNFVGIDLYEENRKMTEERCQKMLAWLERNNLDARLYEC